MKLPSNPLVYEIHTAVFLRRLSDVHSTQISLAAVPDEEWDKLAELGVQAVWLMGVWQRSPAGAEITRNDTELVTNLEEAVPGLADDDIIGSAYCIQNYSVDPSFGGNEGLQIAREQLAKRGIALLLDFVPNHVAPDHPWTLEYPEYFVTASEQQFTNNPANFVKKNETILAKGKDPHFDPWPDVVQLNAFSPGYRQASIDTLTGIATMCDGVRCDMAMLMMNEIFSQTWADYALEKPGLEYWEEVVPAVRKSNPDFLFLAEAYWDTERQLLDQGFDYCYDKTLYDFLLGHPANTVREYVSKDRDYLALLCHFIENHDEPRAASIYDTAKERAAAATIVTLPGMRLVHDGQLEGYKIKIPVHVGKGPAEAVQSDLYNFYQGLLRAVRKWPLENGEWHMYDLPSEKVIAWHWLSETNMHLVFINYSDEATECNAYIPSPSCTNALNGATINSTQQVNDSFVVPLELKPWEVRMLNATRPS